MTFEVVLKQKTEEVNRILEGYLPEAQTAVVAGVTNVRFSCLRSPTKIV